ncbi:MAG: DNA polymerase III subunit delta [Actinobacteria bacterium]|nr:MAG: DNA polymerase III subunit delta [Actinomycetota bacterium]
MGQRLVRRIPGRLRAVLRRPPGSPGSLGPKPADRACARLPRRRLCLAAVAELAAVYLITGTDRPKVGRALRRLRARIGDDATEILSAHEAGGEDVVASCNALGLFAVERRLVIVEDVQRWKAADLKALGEYLPRPAPTSVLVLVGDEVKPDSPLAKAVAEAGEVLVYDLPKRGRKADLPRWVEAELRERGVLVDHEAARAIVELVGDNANELATEVDKLATWADGERIGEREVVALVPARAEAPPFDLTDAWGARDVPGVLAASERIIERSGDATRDVLLRTAGLMTSHVGRVRECRRLDAEGVPPAAAAERLKRNRYYVQKLYEQAGNFSEDELDDAIVRLARLDHALKGGSKLPGELEFTRALIDVSRGTAAT